MIKITLINLLISLYGFVALYDGSMRNRFIENISDFDSRVPAEIIDGLILVISILIIMISIVSSLYLRLLSIIAAFTHLFLCYNIVKYHDSENLAIYVSTTILLLKALEINIIDYDEKNQAKKTLLKQKQLKMAQMAQQKKGSQNQAQKASGAAPAPEQKKAPQQMHNKKKQDEEPSGKNKKNKGKK